MHTVSDALFQRILHSCCFGGDVLIEALNNFWIIVIQRLVLIAIVGVVTETVHEFRSPAETVAPGYVEHLIERLLGDESVVHHIDKYRCANDALVDNNAPVVVGLVVHLGLRPHVESLTHFLDECSVVGIVE